MAPSLFPSKEKEAKKPVKVGPLPEDPPKPSDPKIQKTDVGEYVSFDEPSLIDESAPRRSPQEMFKIIKDLLTKRFNDVERAFFELDEINSMRMSQEQMFQLLRRYVIVHHQYITDITSYKYSKHLDSFLIST